MDFKEAIYSLKPTAVTAMKIVGEATVRTAITTILFTVAAYYLLHLYNINIIIGFSIGSLIANTSHVMRPYLNQKPLKVKIQ